MTQPPLSPRDLAHVLDHTGPVWEELRGRRLFVTGGTGFMGTWLVESFLWANERLKLESGVTVLARDPAAALRRAPHWAGHSALSFCAGDVRHFAFPSGPFSHVIHAATEASPRVMAEDPLQVFDINVSGTRRVLEFAASRGARKFLFTSTGAVYGRQPPELALLPEDFGGGTDPATRATIPSARPKAAISSRRWSVVIRPAASAFRTWERSPRLTDCRSFVASGMRTWTPAFRKRSRATGRTFAN